LGLVLNKGERSQEFDIRFVEADQIRASCVYDLRFVCILGCGSDVYSPEIGSVRSVVNRVDAHTIQAPKTIHSRKRPQRFVLAFTNVEGGNVVLDGVGVTQNLNRKFQARIMRLPKALSIAAKLLNNTVICARTAKTAFSTPAEGGRILGLKRQPFHIIRPPSCLRAVKTAFTACFAHSEIA
jgi:hypothetical protein